METVRPVLRPVLLEQCLVLRWIAPLTLTAARGAQHTLRVLSATGHVAPLSLPKCISQAQNTSCRRKTGATHTAVLQSCLFHTHQRCMKIVACAAFGPAKLPAELSCASQDHVHVTASRQWLLPGDGRGHGRGHRRRPRLHRECVLLDFTTHSLETQQHQNSKRTC